MAEEIKVTLTSEQAKEVLSCLCIRRAHLECDLAQIDDLMEKLRKKMED